MNKPLLFAGKEPLIAVIGLGYVGLPLAVEFAKKFRVTGFDINTQRISELSTGHDSTLEVGDALLKSVLNTGLRITADEKHLTDCNVFIVTVPTPVDRNNRPDLAPLIKASETVGRAIAKGAIVIYESTVYPGCTEEDCIPVIERLSGLKYQADFHAGYSPERINPGDKEHTFSTIRKVTSGSTPEVAGFVDELYNTVVTAGTFRASSIKVAEMAKVIENSQRDINIAFVNEIARICSHLKIDTREVLDAASTKWNFLNFKPGLVGGHCIGVDPYYLAQKAQEAGYHPEIILAGRKMNDTMGAWIALQVVKLMIRENIPVNNSSVLVLGITFKENCPDIRNSKVTDVIREMKDFGCCVHTYDPWANPAEVKHEYGLDLLPNLSQSAVGSRQSAVVSRYDVIILAVAHDIFKELDLATLRNERSVIYDIKGILDRNIISGRV
jgi:UDP-N-acetyl-D-glucosamine/UDP-N-acetyl-D-galactosamine dehydrogenase